MECGQCSGYRPVQGGSRQGDKGGEKPFVRIRNTLIYIYIYSKFFLKNNKKRCNSIDNLFTFANRNK